MKNTRKFFIPLLLCLTLSSCGGSSPSPSPTPERAFTITFNSNGGSNVPSQSIKNGDKVTRPSDPTKDGYAFENWYKDNTLTNLYDFSTPVTTNFTLYAKWNLNFTVTFNSNGGSNVPSQSIKNGNKVTRPSDPTKDGYTFDNWYKEDSLINIYDFETPVTSSFTLYAKWSLKEYTITYILDGGTNHKDNPLKYTIVDAFTFLEPTKEEYTFAYWAKDGAPITEIKKGSFGDITITANWRGVLYPVAGFSNDVNKGTISGSGLYAYNSIVTLTANPIGDCIFKGWYFDSSFTQLLSENNEYQITVPIGGTALYAKFWTKAEEEKWKKDHGIIPTISEDEKTLTYGLYPMSHVNDPYLITIFDKIAPQNDEEYFLYNDEYYVKDTGNPFENSYTFSDGVKVEQGNKYYFKCEAITWNIISKDNNYVIDCSNILYAHRFDDDSNVYANCELRTWLNSDFFDKAFFLNNSNIVPTDLIDVSITGDNVWVGSFSQYDSEWYKDDEARQKKSSDFAICNYAVSFQDTEFYRNASYWTRSSYPDITKNYLWYVSVDGVTYGYAPNISCNGCSPCLTLKINNMDN